jgi:hypothetical protein
VAPEPVVSTSSLSSLASPPPMILHGFGFVSNGVPPLNCELFNVLLLKLRANPPRPRLSASSLWAISLIYIQGLMTLGVVPWLIDINEVKF